MKNFTKIILGLGLLSVLSVVYWESNSEDILSYNDQNVVDGVSGFERKHLMMPEERYKIRQAITFKEDGPNYTPGYQQRELKRALSNKESAKSRIAAVDIIERGPSNVPGRARGLIALPQDATHQTWVVGSSGGGIWKTTNGGASWTDKSPEFPTLAVTSLAYCGSQPNIIYAGTGEYVASAYTNINGDGIFKSTDAGETWVHLTSTSGNDLWQSVTRVVVDPNNPDVVLASTAPNTWGEFTSNIMKSTDGGTSWNSVFTAGAEGAIEQLVADPNDFNILYAGQNGVGVLKSVDAGNTWSLVSNGMSPSSRVELAVSPVNTDRLYASVVGGLDASQEADIYVSDNAGADWVLVTDMDVATVDVLGGQGWYDNTILAHPYNLDEFYIGGIGIYKYTYRPDEGVEESAPGFLGTETGGTEVFMARVNFSADLDGGTVAKGSAPTRSFTSVEVRFGPGMTQKAHRFLVPEGRGSGVPDGQYTYQDYVDVPFEVWDVGAVPERQLMIAFRDQQRDGVFNLINNFTEGDASDPDHLHSREYLYINSRTYEETPSTDIAKTAGHIDNDLFFIWPYLVSGATWDPNNLPESAFKIKWGSVLSGAYQVASVADPYGRVDGNNSNVHPDHHNLIAVIHNDDNKEWQIINVNDGASYASDISTDPGLAVDSWSFAGSTMNTTQFYGADKAPGVDRYVGGAQDNGSWVSAAGEVASKTTQWTEGWGGDGFDAVWHPVDINKLIVTSQNLGVARSTNGGIGFGQATSGLEDSSPPFIGQFANAVQRPDVVYTVGADGVYITEDFAGTWRLVDMASFEDWAASSLMSIEISDVTPDIVWAGTRINGNSGSLFLSVDKGESFNPVPDNGLNTGIFTGIGTDPHDYKTVYVLFAYADSPKVVRSTDLGQTWEDISGFSAGSSSIGFPDVAVYDLQVMPHDPNTIWVGSEIGIIESNDNGASWHLLEANMPRVSVWEIDWKEDQLVIATHGRGVWSYTIPETPLSAQVTYYPEIVNVSMGIESGIGVSVDMVSKFDSLMFLMNGDYVSTVLDPAIGMNSTLLPHGEGQELSVQVVGYAGGAPFTSETVGFDTYVYSTPQAEYIDRFDTDDGNFFGSFEIKSVSGFPSEAIHTPHHYESNSNIISYLTVPIVIKNSDALLRYKDVAIVEPEKDYVTVEGSADGLNWTTISKYDASLNEQWQGIFDSQGSVGQGAYVSHSYDLLDYFEPGDEVVFRFRLRSDSEVNAWGWVIEDLYIQGLVLSAPIHSSGVSIYPNPTSDFVTISSEEAISKVQLFIINGRKVDVRLVDNKLDMRGLRAGVYLVKLTTEQGKSETLRLVKQ